MRYRRQKSICANWQFSHDRVWIIRAAKLTTLRYAEKNSTLDSRTGRVWWVRSVDQSYLLIRNNDLNNGIEIMKPFTWILERIFPWALFIFQETYNKLTTNIRSQKSLYLRQLRPYAKTEITRGKKKLKNNAKWTENEKMIFTTCVVIWFFRTGLKDVGALQGLVCVAWNVLEMFDSSCKVEEDLELLSLLKVCHDFGSFVWSAGLSVSYKHKNAQCFFWYICCYELTATDTAERACKNCSNTELNLRVWSSHCVIYWRGERRNFHVTKSTCTNTSIPRTLQMHECHC